jgi:hypothetical protein
VPSAKQEILRATDDMSDRCVSGLLMMLELLQNPEMQPDMEDRCGLLTEKSRGYEVYALRLPGCARYRLVVSLPEKDPIGGQITMHGPVRATKNTCDDAAAIVRRHLKLVDPAWERAE